MTRALSQLDVLLGDWVGGSKKYSEGRGRMTVAPTEGGKFGKMQDGVIAGQWEFSEDGKDWKVDFDLSYTKPPS